MAVELQPSQTRPRRPPRPGPGDTLRQAWREFRSMRTALVLLVLLAAASILGSLFPQQSISPQRVTRYFQDHPALAPVLDRLLPVANQRYLARAIPNARLRVYLDAAHGFFLEHRRGFVRVVDRFLRARAPHRAPRR